MFGKNFTFDGFDIVAGKGDQQLDLTGASDSHMGVRQTLKTVPGATYSLSFFIGSVYAPDTELGDSSTVDVLVNGGPLATFTNKARKGRGQVQQWRKFSTQFVASKKTTVAFMNGDTPGDTDNAIDGVVVKQMK